MHSCILTPLILLVAFFKQISAVLPVPQQIKREICERSSRGYGCEEEQQWQFGGGREEKPSEQEQQQRRRRIGGEDGGEEGDREEEEAAHEESLRQARLSHPQGTLLLQGTQLVFE